MKRPSFSCFSVFSQVFRNTKLAKVILADGPRGCDMFAAAFNAAYAPWVHDESSVIQAVMPGSIPQYFKRDQNGVILWILM